MGSFRDQLKKANLINAKDEKRLAHEERVARSQAGGAKGVDQQRAAHEEELASKRETQRLADVDRQAELQCARSAEAERAACLAILDSEVKPPSRRAAGPWYFCLSDGRLPRLEVAAIERMQLQEGGLCVVRRGGGSSHDYGLLAIEHARRVSAVLPERIAWAARGALD